jgi:hypothetical protein
VEIYSRCWLNIVAAMQSALQVVVEESIGAYIDAEGTVHTAILDSRIDTILGAHAKKRE